MISVNHLPGMLDRNVLFVDVGPTMTEIDITRGNTLAFSRAANVSVPFQGGELVRDDSRVSSKTELAELELADSVAMTAVKELLVEITRTLQAYRATEAAADIDQIVIAGGTGIESALLEAADERFNLPAVLFDPTVVLGVSDEEAAKLRAFSATLGLAWGLGKEGLLELDFLFPKRPVPPGQALKRRLRMGGIAAAVVLLGAVSYLVADHVQHSRELRGLRQQNAELAKKVEEDQDIDFKRAEADEWDGEARAGVWLDHLLQLTHEMIDPGRRMLVTYADFSIKNQSITLRLECSDSAVALEFAERLNELQTEDGQPIYRAAPGKWQQVSTGDPKFQGKTEVRVELLELSGRKDLKQRERSYRDQQRAIVGLGGAK